MKSALSLLLVLLAVIVAPAMAETSQAPHGLSFAERSLSTTGAKLEAGVKVTILNDTTRTLFGRLRLGDLGLMSTAKLPAPVSTAAVIQFPTRPFEVPPAGERTIVLKAPRLDVAGGEYTGRLTVYDEATGVVDRIPVTLQVGPPVAPAAPAVTSLIDHTYTHEPGAGDPAVELPLDVHGGDPVLTPGASVGVLTSDKGGTAEVTIVDGKLQFVTPGIKETQVKISGIDRAGTYKGTLHLTPGEAGGNLDLQVDARDWWLWPVLALSAGIALALYLRHLKGAARPALALLLDEAEMQQDLETAEAQFRKTASENPWGAYTVKDAFTTDAHNVRNAIEQLGRASFDELDEDHRKAVVKRIDELDKVGPKLGRLAAILADLNKALVPVRDLGHVTDAPAEEVPPLFVASAESLLKGWPLKSLGELDTVLDRAAKANALAVRWPLLHAQAKRARARIDAAASLAAADGNAEVIVAEARRKLVGAWLLLSEAEDADAVVDRDLIVRLSAAVALAAEAAGIPKAPSAPREALTGVEAEAFEQGAGTLARLALPVLPTFGGIVATLPRTTRPRIKALRKTIRYTDWLQIAFAAAVALYTGLTALYWDKAFGGWQNYVAAFLWGSITAGALDALVQAIRTRVAPLMVR